MAFQPSFPYCRFLCKCLLTAVGETCKLQTKSHECKKAHSFKLAESLALTKSGSFYMSKNLCLFVAFYFIPKYYTCPVSGLRAILHQFVDRQTKERQSLNREAGTEGRDRREGTNILALGDAGTILHSLNELPTEAISLWIAAHFSHLQSG